jgi:hypothetical protein
LKRRGKMRTAFVHDCVFMLDRSPANIIE